MHIGGVSHFLAPPQFDFATQHTDGEFDGDPPWVRFAGVELRAAVARFTSDVLAKLVAGEPAPPVPTGLDPDVESKLSLVHRELHTMVADGAAWKDLTRD